MRAHGEIGCEAALRRTAFLSLKCDPDLILELRAEHPDVILPGYYSDGRTWISVDLAADLPERLVLDLCEMSYDLVFARLTKRIRLEIEGKGC